MKVSTYTFSNGFISDNYNIKAFGDKTKGFKAFRNNYREEKIA